MTPGARVRPRRSSATALCRAVSCAMESPRRGRPRKEREDAVAFDYPTTKQIKPMSFIRRPKPPSGPPVVKRAVEISYPRQTMTN
ncbi:hypothetical protein F2P81_025660 [Scophthalmus maximus]|uniref:Uncharacterized protein n=1 Tax=Scophthalmus maximus TaxID=52904 RepID=A0A6A4RPJ9_SCOMX|nr:hypothetical protein F2P81_025660 [Scophthalmus maximus]